MKQRIKHILANSMITFIIWFVFLMLLDLRDTYDLYKGGSIESFSPNLIFPLRMSCIVLVLLIIPIMSILELIRIKNWVRISITLILTFIIAVIYLFATFSITF